MLRVIALALVALAVLASPAGAATKAGVASVDATWHVGASAGQFTDDTGAVAAPTASTRTAHSTKKRISDGVGAAHEHPRARRRGHAGRPRRDRRATTSTCRRTSLTRRVATARCAKQPGARADHRPRTSRSPRRTTTTRPSTRRRAGARRSSRTSSTCASTTTWRSAWRRRSSSAQRRRWSRCAWAATTRTFDEIQAHTYGPKVGDDGTPAGQPYNHTTRQLLGRALRRRQRPGASRSRWPTGSCSACTPSSDVGLRPHQRRHHAGRRADGRPRARHDQRLQPARDRHLGPAQGHARAPARGAPRVPGQRLRAARPRRAPARRRDHGRARRHRAAARRSARSAYQPFVEDFDVAAVSQRFAPPATRPYPGVSNCNTAALFHGDPRVPILGFPDCQRRRRTRSTERADAARPSPIYDQLKEAGVPIPESLQRDEADRRSRRPPPCT